LYGKISLLRDFPYKINKYTLNTKMYSLSNIKISLYITRKFE